MNLLNEKNQKKRKEKKKEQIRANKNLRTDSSFTVEQPSISYLDAVELYGRVTSNFISQRSRTSRQRLTANWGCRFDLKRNYSADWLFSVQGFRDFGLMHAHLDLRVFGLRGIFGLFPVCSNFPCNFFFYLFIYF